ncbi:Uncharacterised protein [uncultured archaeon]|nr:Uncharacterised protein [uncultured archaeon]
MVRVIDYAKVIKHECWLKHKFGEHSLAWEATQTIVAKQYDKDGTDDILRKAMHYANVTNELEEEIKAFLERFCISEVPENEINGLRIDEEDIAQIIWMLGENILAEVHCCQYLGSEVKKFQNASTPEEKEKIKDEVDALLRFAHHGRSIRKTLFSGFFNKSVESTERLTK